MNELVERLKADLDGDWHQYECSGESNSCDCGANDLEKDLRDCIAALQCNAEPVAWRYFYEGPGYVQPRTKWFMIDSLDSLPEIPEGIKRTLEPLYASPQAAQAIPEGIAWKVPAIDGLPKKPGKLAYEQIDCLVLHKGERKHLVWNCEHEVWDGSSGDDFYCEPMDVKAYIEFASLPPLPQSALAASQDKGGERG